jgi:hypothetical protein
MTEMPSSGEAAWQLAPSLRGRLSSAFARRVETLSFVNRP